MEAPAKHPPRRWLQFSLRALLAATFLCAALLGVWIALVQPYRSEARTIALLREHGAVVTTNTEGPRWWRKIAGDEFCQLIIQVHADGPQIGDADLAMLAAAPRLQTLFLGGRCTISEEGLRSLTRSTSLTAVMIEHPAVSNEGLRHLGQVKKLEHLLVWGSFTNQGVESLGGLIRLQNLTLGSPHFTDAGLAGLPPLTGIRELRLLGSFSDAGMPHLKRFSNLEVLSCTGDPARAPLVQGMNDITVMEFIDCPLTDVADYLTQMHSIPFTIDRSELESAQREPGVPVTAEIKNIRLRDGLDQLLASYDLGWIIAEGAVEITTKEAADRSRANTRELRRTLPKLKSLVVEW
jgi:hypothetical protein